LREPEVPLGFDRRAQCRDTLSRFGQEGEDVDLHAAEAELHLVRDDLAKRQDLALVVARDVVGGAVDPERVARFRADVDRLFGQQVKGLIVGLSSLPDAHLAAIEDRDLELHIEAALAERRSVRIAGLPVDAGHIQHRDEAAGFGEIEGLGQSAQFNAGDLQIDPMFDRVNFDAWQRKRPPRQSRQLLRQPEAEIAVPQSQQSDQALPGARCILS
jgi:hypothetical protein